MPVLGGLPYIAVVYWFILLIFSCEVSHSQCKIEIEVFGYVLRIAYRYAGSVRPLLSQVSCTSPLKVVCEHLGIGSNVPSGERGGRVCGAG